MDIYTDGRLDYEKTRNELTALPAVSNAAARKENAQLITTATLLDIAMSLRDVAVLLSPTYTIDTGMTPVEDPDPYIDPEEAYRVTSATPAGTRVKYGNASGRLNGNYGYTEDTDWAEVLFDGPEGEVRTGAQRIWADELVIVPEATIAELAASPVPLAGVATETEAPALLTDEDDDGEPAVGGYDLNESAPFINAAAEAAYMETVNDIDVVVPATDVTGTDPVEGIDEPVNPITDVDDLDADFDGDRHTEATDAVAALKARRKAAKKGK